MPNRRKRAHVCASAAWGEPGGPFPIFVLSDDQWTKIARLSSIPIEAHDARRAFENATSMYRRFEVNDSIRIPSAETRNQLEALRNEALSLLSGLVRLIENPDAHFALTAARQPDEGGPLTLPQTVRLDGHRRLENAMAVLQHLANWLAIASPRVELTKRGPNTANVYWFVAALDDVREKFTGLKITRSYKDAASRDYIAAVCQIANPNIGTGTIDAAMKDRIGRRGRNSG